MAASGSVRLGEPNTPLGSQLNDDDIISKQIQADLNSQAESHRPDLSKRARKRKSRGVGEGFTSDTDENPKLRRKERDRERRKEKRGLKTPRDNALDMSHDSSLNGTDSWSKLTNGTDQTKNPFPRAEEVSSRDSTESLTPETNRDGSKREAKDKNRRYSTLAVVAGRTTLGSNREALLQSILKGCSPEKLTDIKLEQKLPSESESGDVSAAPKVSGTLKTSSKARPRHRVSMVPILPEGYNPGLPGAKGRFHCPVEGCDKLYTRKTTLGEHMNTLHRGQRLKDNKDGTMSIISLEDYKLAISNGNDETIVEIPDTPLPKKPTKAASSKSNGKKEKKTLPTTEASREGSVGSDEAESSGSEEAETDCGPSKAKKFPATGKETVLKRSRIERDPAENETSAEDDSSDNADHSRESRYSSIKSPKSRRLKRTSSVDPPVKASTTEPSMPTRVSTGPRLSNMNGSNQEASEDEMEDWEIEPGVIAGSASNSDDDSEIEHNTAYSSVYTTSAEAGIKFSGVHFQVIRVAPGLVAPGPAVPYLRVCSVATGKVQVQVGDNQFSIGAHGMWRIRAGEKCTLANRHYAEAVIHVSTINTD